MALVYEEKIPIAIRTQFINKVRDISQYLGINPNWLMQVMKAESGINPKARNIQEGRVIAVGLIQFTKAANIGYSLDAIYNMDALQQLDLVRKYYTPYKGKMKSYFDVYLVTFFPAAMGKGDDYVFATKNLSASLIAKQNPAINKDKDGKITMAEFKEYLKRTVPKSLHEVIFSNSGNIFILLFVVAIVSYFLIFQK